MRFCTASKVGLAALVAFLAVDSALAYYNPKTGRFVSRDPVAERGFQLVARVSAPASSKCLKRDPEEPQPYLYAKNSPANRYDILGLKSPCAEAKEKGLDEGDWGGVVCKNGQKHYCVWTPKGTHPGVDYCIGQHERDHDDDVDCPASNDGSVTRPRKWVAGKEPRQEECHAYKAELDCLLKNKPYHCNKLCGQERDDCRKKFDDRIDNVKKLIEQYCNPTTQASQPTGAG
jgi:hypothetical protein